MAEKDMAPEQQELPLGARALAAARQARERAAQARAAQGMTVAPAGTPGPGNPFGLSPEQIAAFNARSKAAVSGGPMPPPVPGVQAPEPFEIPEAAIPRMVVPPVAPRTIDPLSRPFLLPSRGLHYPEAPGWDGRVAIVPTRGEQEEILHGSAKETNEAKAAALRHVTMQCIVPMDPRVTFARLTLEDWIAAALHLLAFSAGSDVIGLRPTHALEMGGCGKASDQSRPLSELPCSILRLAGDGEDPNWPLPILDQEDIEDQVLLELEKAEMEGGAHESLVRTEDLTEPFETQPLPETDEIVHWRLLRMEDMERAEDFAAQISDSQVKRGSPVHTYLLARHIVGINGKMVKTRDAVKWVRSALSPTLDGLRAEINARHYGYDVVPRFRCPHCNGSWRVKLPLDGALFRRRAARTRPQRGGPVSS